MNAIRNKRLAWALHKAGVRLGLVKSEQQRRHEIAEAARKLVHGPPMTPEEYEAAVAEVEARRK